MVALLCNHTIVGQGAERDQRQRLDQHRQRKSIHGEASRSDVKSENSNYALLLSLVFGCLGSPAGQVAGL
jgi:hypothetical protein